VGIALNAAEATYYPIEDRATIQAVLDQATDIVGHNLRFDLKFLRMRGFRIAARIWDTKLLAQLLDENQELGLKPLSEKWLGAYSLEGKREIDRAVAAIKGKSVADLCRADLADSSRPYLGLIGKYCKEDCLNTYRLWEIFRDKMKQIDMTMRAWGFSKTIRDYFLEEGMPTEAVLMDLELKGIRIDTLQLIRYRETLDKDIQNKLGCLYDLCKTEIEEIEEDLYQEAISLRKSERGKQGVKRQSDKHGTKFNWQSADHLRALLFGKLALNQTGIETTSTGALSTAESAIKVLASRYSENTREGQILKIYQTWKKQLKLLTTYTGEDKGLLSHVENDQIYAEYLQSGRGKEGTRGGTVTGRLSSRNPNMQNLPRGSEIKRFFIPDPGHVFIYFDYSQLELRLAAHLSQDPMLLKAYNEGLDLHEITAKTIGEDRQTGKTVNFAMIYDASPYRLAQILTKPPEVCAKIIDGFYSIYQGYKAYLERQRDFMCRHGLVVSELGRVRRLPELKKFNERSREFKHVIKQGYNFPIQSLGASITKRAMIELHKAGVRIVTQVHDSVVVQVPENAAEHFAVRIKYLAENVYKLSVPLKADVKILTSLSETDKWIKKEEKTHVKPEQRIYTGVSSSDGSALVYRTA